jgi:nuclear transport factor 2 (NTF2) superfamily protein
MKTLTVFSVFALIVSIIGCTGEHIKKEPAPGYCVVNDDAGHYFVKRSDKDWVYDFKALVCDSRQAAINESWIFYDGDRSFSAPVQKVVGQLHDVDCAK